MDENDKKKKNHNADIDDLDTLGDGIAGVVADGASDVVPAPSFNSFVHRCSYPRHCYRLSLCVHTTFFRAKCRMVRESENGAIWELDSIREETNFHIRFCYKDCCGLNC